MFKYKFSKKSIVSIVFLLAALFISLFLGSYNFLRVNSPASLPNILENLDNMGDGAAAPAPAPAASKKTEPVVAVSGPSPAPAPASSITDADITKLLTSSK